jgi:hypothetical protein
MQLGYFRQKLRERRAQISLPAVLLAPIFILVIYLLFETAKVSMTKVRHQFALDNAAYSQMSATTTYLNAVAMTNGPMPFRVMRYYGEQKIPRKNSGSGEAEITIFNLFYRSGAVPSLLGDTDGSQPNLRPPQASTDWGVHYGVSPDQEGDTDKNGNTVVISRKDWEKENPSLPSDQETVRLISKQLVENYHFPANKVGVPVLTQYLTTYVYDGSIYKSQDYVYKELTKNLTMFREAYYLNVSNCKRSECGRESAAKLRPYLTVSTKPYEIDKFEVHFSDGGPKASDTHGGAYSTQLSAPDDLLQGQKLFQFAYLDPSSRSKLRSLQRGVLLKQTFKLPLNHFNINLEQKYKPYVRTKVSLTCPRGNNNCVWPNPLPKYSITLDP